MQLAVSGADTLATAKRLRSEDLGPENTLTGALNRIGRVVLGRLDYGVGLSSDVYMKAYNFIRQHHPALMTKLAPVFAFIDRVRNTGGSLRHRIETEGVAAFQLLGSLLNDIAAATLPVQVGPAFAMAGHSGGGGSGRHDGGWRNTGSGADGSRRNAGNRGGETDTSSTGSDDGSAGVDRKGDGSDDGKSTPDNSDGGSGETHIGSKPVSPDDIPDLLAKKGEVTFEQWISRISDGEFKRYWRVKAAREKIKKLSRASNLLKVDDIVTEILRKAPSDTGKLPDQKPPSDGQGARSGDYPRFKPGEQFVDPLHVSFTQASVAYRKRDKNFTFDDMVASMRENCWDGDPVDVVIMPNNALTSADNTRILAARHAGIRVRAVVRKYDELIGDDENWRFKLDGKLPKTWGDAIQFRVKKQAQIDKIYKKWSTQNPYGSLYDPEVTGSP